MQRQSNAKIQTQKAPKDVKQYLADLETLLKRNTGTGTFVGQDTSSNIPMYLPGRVANPTGLSETPSTMQYGNGMTPPLPVERPEPEVYQEFQPQGEVMGATSEQNPISSFFTQSVQNIYQPKQQTQEYMEKLYQATGQAYGVQSLNNGMVLMNDGSVVDPNVEVFPIASDASGGIRMSDGSVRRIDPNLSRYLQGPQALSQALFGGQQAITQEFGNYNPELEPGSGYNMGTDFRTRDLQNRSIVIPFDAEVVQVLQDDGTRFGDISGHQGYGNSILIKLPTGEMLRLSHLSQLPNVQEGQRITAGSLAISPGATGNTTGEHLDLEYYNKSGQIADPSTFDATKLLPYMGATQPQQTQQMSQAAPQPQPAQPRQSVSQPQMQTPMTDAITKVIQAPKNVFEAAKEATPKVEGEFGVSEGLITPEAAQARTSALSQQPKQYDPLRQLVGNVFERVGDTLGIPEGALSESIAGGATKRTNQALASEIGGDKPEIVPGIRQNIRDIGTNIKTSAGEAIGQAGEGLKNLGQSGIDALGNVFKPKQDVTKRAVGDVSGATGSVLGATSSLMDNAPSMQSMSKNDIRDPFFKSGGSEAYKDFLKPNAQDISGGALSLDLFSDEFYQDKNNIKNVFGGTFLAPQAEQKYEAFEAEKRRVEEEKRRQEEESRPRETLQDYLNKGKTAEQFYAETGQQSTLDQIGAGRMPQYSVGSGVTPTAGQASMSGQGYNSVQQASGRTVTAAPGSALRVDSGGNTQQVRNPQVSVAGRPADFMEAPTKSVSAQMAVRPQSSPVSNIFSKAKNFIGNIFRR